MKKEYEDYGEYLEDAYEEWLDMLEKEQKQKECESKNDRRQI